MKRLILFVSLILAGSAYADMLPIDRPYNTTPDEVVLSPPAQFNPVDRPSNPKPVEVVPTPPAQFNTINAEKSFQFKMNGRWMPYVDPLLVGANNYTSVVNMRPLEASYESSDGYTYIADEPDANGTPLNAHHFFKPGESHFLEKIQTTGGAYELWDNATAIPSAGAFNSSELATVGAGRGSFSNGPGGLMLYADDSVSYVYGGDELHPLMVFGSASTAGTNPIEYTDALVTDDSTASTVVVGNGGTGKRYLFIGTPYILHRIKVYVSSANVVTGSLALASTYAGGFTARTINNDGTASGGAPLAQTGFIDFSYATTTTALILNGNPLNWYRLDLNTFNATIYKITVGVTFQPIRDSWNGSPRVCTSFQASRSSVFEDGTFFVEAKDSTTDSAYAAKVGGLTASDEIVMVFDEPVMGVDIVMVSGKVNAAAAKVDTVTYWTGETYTSVSGITDTTLSGTASYAQSGRISWGQPTASNDAKPREIFGIYGYVYKFGLDGTLTDGTSHDGTSIDYVTGITAPIRPVGYNIATTYSNRALFIDGNRIDYSQTGKPWIFNGVDAAVNDDQLSLFIGDSNPIVATQSIYNRYGSNLIESLLLLKASSIYALSGVQPYYDRADPFVIKQISDSIGCAAPMTVRAFEMEIDQGLTMRGAVWLANTGVYFFKGDVPERIPGIEAYFDPSDTEHCINYSYIQNSLIYIDTVHSEMNLLFPRGSSTTINTWLAYSFKYKKWYWKIPSSSTYSGYPMVAAPVYNTTGIQYNYAVLNGSDNDIARMDNGLEWAGDDMLNAIYTGYFSPPFNDELGFWDRSTIRGLKLVSEKLTADVNATAQLTGDSTCTALTIDLSPATGAVSVNEFAKYNYNCLGAYFQGHFYITTMNDTVGQKWNPLAWGYNAQFIRSE